MFEFNAPIDTNQVQQDVYMDKRSAGREAADAFDAVWGPEEESEKCP